MNRQPIVFLMTMVAALGLLLVALFAPTAQAQQLTVEVDPGTPGQPANTLSWQAQDPTSVIKILFSDQKTCKYPSGIHVIALLGPPNTRYVGTLLDAAGDPIPDTALIGDTQSEGDLPTGFVDLSKQPGSTVFSGILIESTFEPAFFELRWISPTPTVGQVGDETEVTIGGTVTGLEGSGLVLQNNGADDLPIDADGEFTFETPLQPGSTYNVTVLTHPSDPSQVCTVENGSGNVPNESVTNVAVACVASDLINLKKVAAEGDTLADDTVLKDILLDGGVAINFNGQVAFGGRDGNGTDAVFTQGGAVVKEGDTLNDGTTLAAFRGQGQVGINVGQGRSGGKVAFHGQAEAGLNDTAAVFTQAGKVAAVGDTLSEGITLNDIDPEGKVAINNADQLAFHGSVEVEDGLYDKYFRVVFIADEMETFAVVREGSKLPDGTPLDDITESGGVAISDLEEVAFHGQTVNPDRGGDSLKAVFTSWGLVAREGADLPDGTILDDINENGGVAINLMDVVAFHGQTIVPDRGGDSVKAVFIADGRNIRVVVKEGDVLDDGSTLDEIEVSGGVAINLYGEVAFHGRTGDVKAVFNQNGVVAKVGDIVDDGSILIEISSSAGVAINPYERQVAFHGRINSVDAVFVSLTPIPNSKPVADFTYATDDLTVTFTDLSRDRDGDVVAWSWDFGDGSTSTEQNPSHTYAEAGNYNVSLTVEDDQSGVSEPAEQSVEVSAPSSGEVVQVFATSVPHNGNFGGLPGADQFCQELAVTAGLSGTWRAWLSDENTDARDRIPDGEYRLLDASETVVASDLEDLTDGELDAPINVSEKGGPPATSSVWTSTKTDGTSIDPVPPGNTTSNCFNWTNADTSSCSPGDQDCGARGSTAAIDGTWTLLGGQANPSLSQCSTMQSIYCFGGGQ